MLKHNIVGKKMDSNGGVCKGNWLLMASSGALLGLGIALLFDKTLSDDEIIERRGVKRIARHSCAGVVLALAAMLTIKGCLQ